MSFIFVLFLVTVAWFVISVLRIAKNARRQTRNFFDQFSQQTRQEPSRQAGWSRPAAQKSKKIDRNTGEYVEFEEITTTTTYTSETQTDGHTTTTRETQRTESQITDVEWEDI